MKSFISKGLNTCFILAFAVLSSCSNDETTPVTPPVPVAPNVSFNVSILAPAKDRDYSYANDEHGIFDDPLVTKEFKGSIFLGSGSGTLTPDDFTVKWSSSIDGTLYQGQPDEQFRSTYISMLSKGVHIVKFESFLTDFPETVKSDSITISNIIKLNSESKGNAIKLTWNKYEAADFVSYKVYREDFEPIAEIFDINNTEYIDNDIPNIIKKYKYQVVVNTTNTSNYIYGSTLTENTAAVNISVPYFVTKTIKDPVRNRIYALLSNGFSGGTTIFGIAILNPETMEIENNLLPTQTFNDASISSDGNTMYLTQKYVDKVTVIDLNTFSTSIINIDTGGWGLHKVEDTNTDFLICHRQPPTSGSTQLMLINKHTGNISEFLYNSHGDIAYNSNNNKLFMGESNTSSGVIRSATFNGNSLTYDNLQFPGDWSGYTYPSPLVVLSDDKNSVFWQNYQLDNNLNVIREFEEHILACSPANLYLAGTQNIYTYNSPSAVFSISRLPEPDSKNVIFVNDHMAIVTVSIDDHYTDRAETTYFIKITLP